LTNPTSSFGKVDFELPYNVEDEAAIVSLSLYKESKTKQVVYTILCFLTIGMTALFARWKVDTKIKLRYQLCQISDASHIFIHGKDGTKELIPIGERKLCILKTSRMYKVFNYRLYTYYLDDLELIFKPISFSLDNKKCAQIHTEMGSGLKKKSFYEERMQTYGPNETNIPMKTNWKILVDEILSPFYIFQACACVLWYNSAYEIYATFILVVSVVSVVLSFTTIKANYKKLHEQCYFEIDVNVYRPYLTDEKNVTVTKIRSSDLVPGDLIEILPDEIMSCDVAILNGSAVMNESMLTGESIPVSKVAMPRTNQSFDPYEDKKYILYAGTTCLETRRTSKEQPVLGLVIRTGFFTIKGQLVRSMLYPRVEDFKLYRDAFKFIIVLAMMSIGGFMFTVKTMLEYGKPYSFILERSLDLITITVPPALATCITIGADIAIKRLETKKIICKSQPKINVAGRVDVMCFDKTGTLTEDGLDMHGVMPVKISIKNGVEKVGFQNLVEKSFHKNFNRVSVDTKDPSKQVKSLSNMLLELMASCHSLTTIKGKICGDPLDVKMFESIRWGFIDVQKRGDIEVSVVNSPSCQPNQEAGHFKKEEDTLVLKKFEFIPQLQRMSVIVQDPKERHLRLYAKGSPEMIKDLCRAESIPEDFHNTLAYYTENGFRVLACATRKLDITINASNQMSLDRGEMEKDLTFLGFLIMLNKLKPVTKEIISNLNHAQLKCVMATGDNPLTAISVARECGLVQPHQKVVLGAGIKADNQPGIIIQWSDVEFSSFKPISTTFTRHQSFYGPAGSVALDIGEYKRSRAKIKSAQYNSIEDVTAKSPVSKVYSEPAKLLKMLQSSDDVVIAMTGNAFSKLEEFLTNEGSSYKELYEQIMNKAIIFSRMHPEHKSLLIQAFQAKGLIVGMCGDGANDCIALKTANVGVSLSEAEASLAAPFLSKITDISCIDVLFREGRAALTTSFQCFKYMALYSVIQSITVTTLYKQGANLTQRQFLFIDLIFIIPLAVTMSYTQAYHKLSKTKPTSSLVSTPVLTSILGQVLIQITFQIIMLYILWAQPWYQSTFKLHTNVEDDYDYYRCQDNTTLFLFANAQYISTVLGFANGRPYRKPFYTNISFTVLVVGLYGLAIGTILSDSPWLMEFTHQYEIPYNFRYTILALAIVNSIITIFYEKKIVPKLVVSFKEYFNKKKVTQ